MNKLVLVPESMYKGLLKNNSANMIGSGSRLEEEDDLRDRINLEHTKRKLASVKTKRGLNASARNTLMNQELRRYMAQREEAKNEPVKVEIVPGGARYVTKRGAAKLQNQKQRGRQAVMLNDAGEEIPAILPPVQRRKKRRAMTPVYQQGSDSEDEEEPTPPSFVSLQGASDNENSPRRRRTIARSSSAVSVRGSRDGVFSDLAHLPSTSFATQPPLTPQEQQQQLGDAKQQTSPQQRIDGMYNYLLTNKRKFGITKDNAILDKYTSGGAIKNVDLGVIAEILLNRPALEDGDPAIPAVKAIFNKGIHDADFCRLIGISPPQKKRQQLFNPNLWR